jgi:hypothetical protein
VSLRSDISDELTSLRDRLRLTPLDEQAPILNQIRELETTLTGFNRLLGLDAIGGLGEVSSEPNVIRTPSATN